MGLTLGLDITQIFYEHSNGITCSRITLNKKFCHLGHIYSGLELERNQTMASNVESVWRISLIVRITCTEK
jgi:hypothetical protein